jgi:hypothetical protein
VNELVVRPNLADPDGFYAELLALHEGRSAEQSASLNVRLVLLLANHIGDLDVLRQAMRAAAEAGEGPPHR